MNSAIYRVAADPKEFGCLGGGHRGRQLLHLFWLGHPHAQDERLQGFGNPLG